MTAGLIWACVALLAVLALIGLAVVRLGGKAAETKQAESATEAEKAQADKIAQMAEDVVSKPTKQQVIDSLKNNTFCLLLLLFLLSACQSHIQYVCPPMPKHDATFNTQAIAQLQTLPEATPVVTLVEEYGAVRLACKR